MQNSKENPKETQQIILVERFLQTKNVCFSKIFFNKDKKGENYYGLENPVRLEKILGTTAIPAGVYEIKLRTFGGFHKKYKKLFKDYHKGMLEIKNVPNFTDVLIHIGNYAKDTEGCLLIGTGFLEKEEMITSSKAAYFYFYIKVLKMLAMGKVFIEFTENNLNNKSIQIKKAA